MITGYFISVNVPEVPVGEDIKATIDFYAINPGELLWQSFLVVESPGLDLRALLDAANETGAQGGREKTYNLGPMPDKDITFSFFIFGHQTSAPFYSWDWGVYNGWMEGFPLSGGLVYLDSEYKFLSPGKVVNFSLEEPTAYPDRAPPGPVLITCKVTSQSNIRVTAQVKVIVYEGSGLYKHGTQLWADTKTVTFNPGETKPVQFIRTSIVGTTDRRDVEVEVRVDGQLIVEHEWDDVFFVTPGLQEGKIETKELEIMGDRKYSIPVSREVLLGSKAKVHVVIKNTGDIKFKPGMVWHVKGPDGNDIPGGTYDHQAWVSVHPGETSHFFEAIATFELNDIGDYSIEIWLLDQDNKTLEYWQGKLVTVSEEEPPPPDGGEVFSGQVLNIEPLQIRRDTPIALVITYEPKTKSLIEATNGWWAEVEVTLNSTVGLAKSGLLFGKEPGVLSQEVKLDKLMPYYTMSGKVVLKCYKGGFSGYSEVVDTKTFSLEPSDEPPPPPSEECEIGAKKCERGDLYECVSGPEYNFWELIEQDSSECAEKGFPWLAVSLLGGGVAIMVAAFAFGPKKKK